MVSKACSGCIEVLELTEYGLDKRAKDGHTSQCKKCVKSYNAARYIDNRDSIRATQKIYDATHKQQRYERNLMWQRANKDKCCAYSSEFRKHNKQKVAKCVAKWRKDNSDRVNASNTAYRLKKIRAMPEWADKEAIEMVYAGAKLATQNTGVKHEVDHIVPLRGKYVSGLHVDYNLQVLTALENSKKGNRFGHQGL